MSRNSLERTSYIQGVNVCLFFSVASAAPNLWPFLYATVVSRLVDFRTGRPSSYTYQQTRGQE